jgi:polyhydroxyalkanoate synthesis regulator phasin
MAEKPLSAPHSTPSAPPVRRGSYNAEDSMAQLTERARLISQDAGTKVTSAMRDMIGAAAGIAGFAVESARDLVQYMVRRGQMTQAEADKLIREAEATHLKKPKAERDRLAAIRAAADKAAAEKKAAMLAAEQARPVHRVTTPGRILAQGAGKSVKQMPNAKSTDATKAADKHGVKIPEKPVAKPAPAVKASAKAAPAPKAPAAKAAPAVKASPAKKAAKAPSKPAAKKTVKKKR